MKTKSPQELRQVEAEKSLNKAWDKLFSLLITASHGVDRRTECNTLMTTVSDERAKYINTIWGGTALAKVGHLLDHINDCESALDRSSN